MGEPESINGSAMISKYERNNMQNRENKDNLFCNYCKRRGERGRERERSRLDFCDLSTLRWSLGAIMYEMLIGYPPFYSDNSESTCWKVKMLCMIFRSDALLV